jgi:hypothetical protein
MMLLMLLMLLLLLLQMPLGQEQVGSQAEQRYGRMMVVGQGGRRGGGGRDGGDRRHMVVGERDGGQVGRAGVVVRGGGGRAGEGNGRLLHVLLQLLHVPLELGAAVLEPADHLEQGQSRHPILAVYQMRRGLYCRTKSKLKHTRHTCVVK